MITHTELTDDGDFDDTKEEVSFKIEDLGERIGEKRYDELERVRWLQYLTQSSPSLRSLLLAAGGRNRG